MVLICISLMADDVDPLLKYLFVICIFSLENVYLEPLPISKLNCHFIIKPQNSLYILDICPLSEI